MTNTRITDPEILERRYCCVCDTKTMTRFLFIQISSNIEVLLSEGGHRRVGSISRRRWCIERGHVPSTSHIISTDRAKSVSAVWNEWCVHVCE